MNLVVAVVGFAFVVFVVFAALMGRKARRVTSEKLNSNVDRIYDSAQTCYRQKNGRMSSELAEARTTHLKLVNGRASATK